MTKTTDKLSPKQFAKVLGKSLGFVRKIIDAGEITVEDVRSPGSSLPRYEIDPAEATRWRATRRERVDRKRVPRKKHHRMRNVHEVIR